MVGYAFDRGYDWDELDHRQQVNMAEQALFTPMLHGSTVTIDALLDGMADALIEAFPTEENWGTGPSALKAAAAAEARAAQFQAAPRGKMPRRDAPVEPAASTMPSDDLAP